jgi:opacity protein-like surface antigen
VGRGPSIKRPAGLGYAKTAAAQRVPENAGSMTIRPILAVIALTASMAGAVAHAQDRAAPADTAGGFYGGVALRNAGVDEAGIRLGHLASASTWGRFASPVSDDVANRALVFGGYRWANDVAIEGSLATAANYSLQPLDAAPRGIGLSLGGTPQSASRTWNADVYTSWSFRKAFALYGRLGYAQSENAPAYAMATLPIGDARRLRDGMNYGVGVRYDVSPALGLRLEYARFSRFAGEAITGPLPESDQVQLGMQFRF